MTYLGLAMVVGVCIYFVTDKTPKKQVGQEFLASGSQVYVSKDYYPNAPVIPPGADMAAPSDPLVGAPFNLLDYNGEPYGFNFLAPDWTNVQGTLTPPPEY